MMLLAWVLPVLDRVTRTQCIIVTEPELNVLGVGEVAAGESGVGMMGRSRSKD